MCSQKSFMWWMNNSALFSKTYHETMCTVIWYTCKYMHIDIHVFGLVYLWMKENKRKMEISLASNCYHFYRYLRVCCKLHHSFFFSIYINFQNIYIRVIRVWEIFLLNYLNSKQLGKLLPWNSILPRQFWDTLI